MRHSTLRIHSPTSSTTAYTVTNASPRTSRVSQLLRYLVHCLRGLTALVCITLLYVQITSFFDDGQEISVEGAAAYSWLEHVYTRVEDGRQLSTALRQTHGDRLALYAPSILCAGLLWLLSRRGYDEESLLALRSLGIQISTSSHSLFSTPTTRFIPTSQIQDIFIHEAFIGFSVKFYLAVIVEGEEEAVVVFPKLLPRREVLEQVWRGAREVLWGVGGRAQVKRNSHGSKLDLADSKGR